MTLWHWIEFHLNLFNSTKAIYVESFRQVYCVVWKTNELNVSHSIYFAVHISIERLVKFVFCLIKVSLCWRCFHYDSIPGIKYVQASNLLRSIAWRSKRYRLTHKIQVNGQTLILSVNINVLCFRRSAREQKTSIGLIFNPISSISLP